jgi:CHAD domain-containing protein
MKGKNTKRIQIINKRFKIIPRIDFLIKVETNYCIDEITSKTLLLTDKYDEDILHQTRIALRKLKSLVYFFNDLINNNELPLIKKLIHQLISPTSIVRDYDVIKANYIYPSYLENNNDADFKKFMIHSINEIHNIQENTLSKLLSHEYQETLTDLRNKINGCSWDNLPGQYYGKSLGKYIDKKLNKELDAIYMNIKYSYRLNNKNLHHFRIKIKEIRYVIEFFKFYIKHYKTVLKELKELQDILGEINDTYVANSIIHDLKISTHLISQHNYIKKKILKNRKSNIHTLKNKI